MSRLASGQRVLYLPAEPRCGRYAHCARQVYYSLEEPVSGMVLRVVEGMIDIRPDGWPLPPGVWPEGFASAPEYLTPLPEQEPARVGKLTNGTGMPLDVEAVRAAVCGYLSHAADWNFQATSREEALAWLAEQNKR